MLGLRWEHLDLGKGTVHVETAISGQIKNNESIRFLKLPAFVLDVPGAVEQGESGERVFLRADGVPVNLENYAYWLKRFASKAKLGDRHPHELRHTGLSIMKSNGLGIDQVSEVAGHAPPGSKVTKGYALHEVSEEPKPITWHVEAMEAWWSDGRGNARIRAV